jgi:2-dehydro-3-deoxygluconokinase
MFGNEEDFAAALGFDTPGATADQSALDPAPFGQMMTAVGRTYPNLKLIATTLRVVRSANCNDWGAICWANGQLHRARPYPSLNVLDRIGGGDSFASGLIYGLLSGMDVTTALEYGTAHGALAMTTPGDTSMATAAEVAALVNGGNARVRR